MTINLRPFFSQFSLTDRASGRVVWKLALCCDHSEAEKPTIFYEC